ARVGVAGRDAAAAGLALALPLHVRARDHDRAHARRAAQPERERRAGRPPCAHRGGGLSGLGDRDAVDGHEVIAVDDAGRLRAGVRAFAGTALAPPPMHWRARRACAFGVPSAAETTLPRTVVPTESASRTPSLGARTGVIALGAQPFVAACRSYVPAGTRTAKRPATSTIDRVVTSSRATPTRRNTSSVYAGTTAPSADATAPVSSTPTVIGMVSARVP